METAISLLRAALLPRSIDGRPCSSAAGAHNTRPFDTGWRVSSSVQLQDARNLAHARTRNFVFEPGTVLDTILWLQQQRDSQRTSGGGGLSRLPISVVRAICQQLSHADIEQCRLVCSDWRTSFGEASVTDMYLAMCADFPRASDLTLRFSKAYPNFHHLHFWIPGGPVRQMMGTDGSTFSQYMDLFSSCPVRVLTAHYLDDTICPVQGITRLKGLTKLELVDLMPANASLACLSSLPNLRHLILEYKDSSASPDLASIGQLPSLSHLELALHSTFVTNPVYMTFPSRVSGLQGASSTLTSRPTSDWLSLMLSSGGDATGQVEGVEAQSRLEAILEAILDAVPSAQSVGLADVADEAVAVLNESLLAAEVAAVMAAAGVADQQVQGMEQGTLEANTDTGAATVAAAGSGLGQAMEGMAVSAGWAGVEGMDAGTAAVAAATVAAAEAVVAAAEAAVAAAEAAAAAAVLAAEAAAAANDEAEADEGPEGQGLRDQSEEGEASSGAQAGADAGAMACLDSLGLATGTSGAADYEPADTSAASTQRGEACAAEPACIGSSPEAACCTAATTLPAQQLLSRSGDGTQSISDDGGPAVAGSSALPILPGDTEASTSRAGTLAAALGEEGDLGELTRQLVSHPVFDGAASWDQSYASEDGGSVGEAEAQGEAGGAREDAGQKGGEAEEEGGVDVACGCQGASSSCSSCSWTAVAADLHAAAAPIDSSASAMLRLKDFSAAHSRQAPHQPWGVLDEAGSDPFTQLPPLMAELPDIMDGYPMAYPLGYVFGTPGMAPAIGRVLDADWGGTGGDDVEGLVSPAWQRSAGLAADEGAEAEVEAEAETFIADSPGTEASEAETLESEAAEAGPEAAGEGAGPGDASAVGAIAQSAEGENASYMDASAAHAPESDAGPSSPSTAAPAAAPAATTTSAPQAECVASLPSADLSAGGSSDSGSAGRSHPMRTLAVSAADYLLASMVAHWSKLRNLQHLELRCCPHALARCYPLLFSVIPSLTELKLVGPDARLKAYGPSQPAFKVEVSRDSVTLALAPSMLALALHCDNASDTSAALQQLTLLAASVAPPAAATATAVGSTGGSSRGGSSGGGGPSLAGGHTGASVGAGAVSASSSSVPVGATASGVTANRHTTAWAPWSSAPSFGEMLAAASAPPAAYAVGAPLPASSHAAAMAVADEKRRQQVMLQHPSLGILQAHGAKLATLRLYLENPEFSTLKPLTQLPHLQELYIALCFTSGSDSESEDDMLTADDVSFIDEDTAPVAGTAGAGAGPAAAAGAEAGLAAGGGPVTGTGAQQHSMSADAAGQQAGAGDNSGTLLATSLGGAAVGMNGVGHDQAGSSRQAPQPSVSSELSPKHIVAALRSLTRLTSLTVREEIPAGEEGSPCSHEQCALSPASCSALVHSLKHLVHLEWQGMLSAPHPSSLQALSSLACLRSLTLVVNQDDPMARLGVHCLPPSLSSLTLQNISVAAAPRCQPHRLPTLCHLHLKSCAIPDMCTFSTAPSLEWLSLDNCDVAMYVPDLVDLWPSLSWLEITYTHQDWRLLHSPTDLPALGSLTRLRKLSLVAPYEELLTTDALLGLTQLRLLSISPSPQMGYEQFMRLAELRFLAGLEVKLYSDVLHHEELVDMAGAMHADLQESLPMTDVLIMCDDAYADEPS